jgi:hypothetical protein
MFSNVTSEAARASMPIVVALASITGRSLADPTKLSSVLATTGELMLKVPLARQKTVPGGAAATVAGSELEGDTLTEQASWGAEGAGTGVASPTTPGSAPVGNTLPDAPGVPDPSQRPAAITNELVAIDAQRRRCVAKAGRAGNSERCRDFQKCIIDGLAVVVFERRSGRLDYGCEQRPT